jgi:S1-C subfamily serine protease
MLAICILICLSVLIQALSYRSVGGGKHLLSARNDQTLKSADKSIFKSQELDLINVYESRRDSVAYISRISQAFNPLLMNVMEIPSLSGSGFIWDESHIVTNNHVIDGQKEVFVTFVNAKNGSRQSYRAQVRGGDKERDIAVLKVISNNGPLTLPPPLPLADPSNIIVGQSVAAIGNPFGLDQTLTSGIVSGLGRQIRTQIGNVIYDMIQTDAAINPGNSGGPLLDSNGRLIGMNTAIYSTSGTFSGVGFAIPVDMLEVVVNCIIKTGSFQKPSTGIQFVGGYQAKLLGVEDGLLVLSVVPGSPAEQAGIRTVPKNSFFTTSDIALADVILRVNGKSVLTEADFLQSIYNKQSGDMIEITVRRAIVPPSEYPSASQTAIQDKKKESREVTLQLRLK